MTTLNTRQIQMQSIIEFAKALNVTCVVDGVTGQRYFVPSGGKLLGMERISVNTMIELHNNDVWVEEPESKGFYYAPKMPSFMLSKYMWNKSQAAKIVHKVKCKYSKKSKDVVVQSHMVKFTDKNYYDLFLNSNNQ